MKEVTKTLFTIGFLWCIGCSPKGTGVFVNATEKSVVVAVYSSSNHRQTPFTFILAPGESRKMIGSRVVDTVTVKWDKGPWAISHRLYLRDERHEYARSGEMEMHFLIGKDEIYRIPRKYRAVWQENLDHIETRTNALRCELREQDNEIKK